MVIVAANKNYDIYLTSTTPNQLRFRLLNADDNFKIRLSMHYTTSNRIDMYRNGQFVAPTNARYVNNQMTLVDPQPSNPAVFNAYMPQLSSTAGTNLFVKQQRKCFFSMSGGSYLDLQIAPFLVVSFGVPAITPESFFNSDTLVTNLAQLLGLDPSQIRYVQIVRANGTTTNSSRRRRDVSGVTTIEIRIFQNAVSDLVLNQATLASQMSQIKQTAANIVNRYAMFKY